MIDTISPNDNMFLGSLEGYLANARSAYLAIERSLFSAGIGNASVRKILDFGCGYGRILRAIREAHPNAQIVAADLMADAIKFCAETFDATPVQSHEDVDRIAYPCKFDLIWVGSVFTHLHETGFKKLFSHLVENLAPDGLLVFTTHGRSALWVIEKHRMDSANMPRGRFLDLKTKFNTTGFGFVEYGSTPIKHSNEKEGAALTEGEYGFSCSRTDWVCQMVAQRNDVILSNYREGGWGGNHDVVAVQRPKIVHSI